MQDDRAGVVVEAKSTEVLWRGLVGPLPTSSAIRRDLALFSMANEVHEPNDKHSEVCDYHRSGSLQRQVQEQWSVDAHRKRTRTCAQMPSALRLELKT